MPSYKNTSLHQKLSCKRSLRKLCAEAIKQQVASGQAEATHLRNRRRHLARQILKRLPHASRLSTKKLLHAATMLLAMWGFAGISMPDKAEAATLFKHVMLNGVHVGSSAAPTFADIDNDGDLDVFVGEVTGTVKFYRNDGTNAAPDWVADIAANPLAGFNVGLFASPSFADIDNDGDLDAFIGVGGNYNVASGTVKFYRNNGTAAAPNFVADTVGNPLAGFDVGTYAKPNFADIDNDGDLDAFVGVGGYKAVSGTVKFYQNTGTAASPTFVAVNGVGNPLNGFNVGRYAAPSFADIDNDGDLDVFIGSGGYKAVSGTVKFYRNSGTNTAPVFAADAAGNPLAGSMARNTVPSFADIDGDGDLDAFVGEAYGTVKSYRNTGTATAPVFTAIMGDGSVGNPLSGFDVGYNATPSFADIDNDGDLDAFVGEKGGSVKFYQNTGTAAAPTFTAIAGTGNPLNGVAVNSYATPTFADIDNDGDLDAFVGEDYGTVKFYQNTGTAAAPAFTAVVGAGNPLNGFAVRSYAKPSFADIDNDGDLDAFVGSKNRGVAFYRNTGTAAVPVFTADVAGNPLNGFFTIASGIRLVSPSFADIDNDGDLDAFVGERSGAVKFYRNTGSATAPVFTADTAGNPLNGFVVTRSAAP
ncbi:MAG: VCBS repeat-containing protein, partial [Mariprofundaceae bacterium]|nr:VCBS repeat-containing protein [Mariprofundaceae bacterium]